MMYNACAYIYATKDRIMECMASVYSFLDKKGNQFSKYTFEKATSFYNGYAMVILEGKDALLDSAGKIIYVSDILNK